MLLILEQLGNSKIEQLYLPVMADQNIRGLEIPVHDQVRVRVGDGQQHVEKQPDTRLDTKPVLVAVAVDVVALNVLEDEVRLSCARYPGLDQFGDIRMGQAPENVAFALESLLFCPADQGDFEKFHRYFSLKSRVVSFRQPDAAHAPLPDLCDQSVSAQCLTGQARFGRQSNGSLLEKALPVQGAVMTEQVFHVIRQRRILSAQAGQPG